MILTKKLIPIIIICYIFSLQIIITGVDIKPQGVQLSKTELREKKVSRSEIIRKETPVVKLKMKATAYDLSYESCGKNKNHPQYGITFSGRKAIKGRTVAVDPKIIPLNSKLNITFPDKYKYLNGNYIAEDTGGGVKGYMVDIFLGEDVDESYKIHNEVDRFGIQDVSVIILK